MAAVYVRVVLTFRCSSCLRWRTPSLRPRPDQRVGRTRSSDSEEDKWAGCAHRFKSPVVGQGRKYAEFSQGRRGIAGVSQFTYSLWRVEDSEASRGADGATRRSSRRTGDCIHEKQDEQQTSDDMACVPVI